MADSSQHFLYGQHSTVAVSPLKAKTSAKLLDVLIETGRKGSNPIVQNVGSPLTKTIRKGAEDEEDLFLWDRDQVDVKHRVKSRKSLNASLRFFESATLDLHGDRDLECKLRSVGLEIWVIYEILYAEKWSLTTDHSRYEIQPDAVGATPITWSEDPHFDLQLHLGAHFLKPPAEQQDDNGEDLESFEIVVMNPDDEED
ncbi:unnamed protein product [Sphagnum balticum]